MSNKRYTEEFRIEAVRHIVDRGYSVAETARRLGTTTYSLYAWKKKYGPDSAEHQLKTEKEHEIRRLKKELRRVTEERDILKEASVTDITHIRTNEGWLYLSVVIDLYSRKVVGWSMQSRIKKEWVLNALLMAVWRRKPTNLVTVHSDQGSQNTSHDWQMFLNDNHLQASMSRRGNCHDNAVAESFFQLLKRERFKRHIYSTRDDARGDVVEYIEMFYNSKRY